MASADVLVFVFFFWTSAVLSTGLGCPELCTCSDKNDRHSAECSYKGLSDVPGGLPHNVTSVSLSANKIAAIPLGSFDNVTLVTSLWISHNRIVSIQRGALSPLVHLRNFDVSHNKMVDFPWEDLQNLTGLHLLKMNNNEMTQLPRDALSTLKDLRSLRLNNNRFLTIAEGTFDGLVSLSYLQIYKNPFACTCSLNWLRSWISTTTISVQDQELIVCESPEKFKGEMIAKLPESKCVGANVRIKTESDPQGSAFYEGSALILTCEFTGNPKPMVMWSVRSKSLKRDLALSFTEDDSAESNEVPSPPHSPVRVFHNGTLVISPVSRDDSGNYSCSATNEFGRAEEAVSVTVVAPEQRPTPSTPETQSRPQQTAEQASTFESAHRPDFKREDVIGTTSSSPTAGVRPAGSPTGSPPRASKCGLTATTRYVSSHVYNGSLDDIKQYTFDFGVIALGVSETEATVRLNPLLIPRDRGASAPESLQTGGEEVLSNGLYLCITDDRRHAAVQWSRIREGVNTYTFGGLRPATNYSLCLTYRGEDCEVQVLFATRRRVPNLLIIISVSICLLTVSTVPLLGATCFHLVYKYRSKTYKLILKAKDQYHAERSLAGNLNIRASHTESQRRINGSQLDEEEEEEGETESGDGEKEADTEESILTESFSLSQCRGALDNCEGGSEYSDRLPLGAEAVNITSNYKYPNQ